MDLSDNGGVKHTGWGVEGVDGRVNSEFSQSTIKHSVGVKMGEGGGWGGIGKIIGWDVDGLDGCDGAGLRWCNSLLEGTQVGSEGWLITDSRWNTSKKGGHFGAGLGESEDVVDEKEHVLVLFISEVFGNRQTS